DDPTGHHSHGTTRPIPDQRKRVDRARKDNSFLAGGRMAFNVRGAVDATLARRRAVLELKAQSTGDLGLPDTWSLSPFFFKFLGSVTMMAGFALLALTLILVTD
ncbi:hypothetical protein, partial [Streptomyces violaceorubidus]